MCYNFANKYLFPSMLFPMAVSQHCLLTFCNCCHIVLFWLLFCFTQSMFFSLEMHNGFLYLRYDFGFSNGPILLEDSMKKARINDAKFHEVQMWLLSQSFDQLSQRLQAEITAPMPMKGAKGWGSGGDMVEQAEE